MAFVKLDCGMLDSTIWFDRDAREVFITALLMATPREITEDTPQLKVSALEPTGFVVPPGWYGFVAAAGPGIVHRAKVEESAGLAALERLGMTDAESRTPDHEGRRMVRVDGGYLILNFDKYRQKDHTAADRSRRYRERMASRVPIVSSRVTERSVTQAEAEAEAEEKKDSSPKRSAVASPASDDEWLKELEADPTYAGVDVRREHGKMTTWCRTNKKQATRRRFVNWLNRCDKPMTTGGSNGRAEW